jgi:hypothetical protein
MDLQFIDQRPASVAKALEPKGALDFDSAEKVYFV